MNVSYSKDSDKTFEIASDSNIHISEYHDHVVSFPPIPQLDGVDDMLDIISTEANPAVSDLVARYTLNQKRQLSGLAKHSKLNDFEIETNDNGKNVNIQCSSGFYEAVAKPSFSSLSSDFQLETMSVLVECVEIRKSRDLAGNQPGVLLKFKLHDRITTYAMISVSVHLHHTQQKVQLQGGATMADGGTAAVWFTQNILKHRFNNEAKDKKFDIDAINRVLASINNAAPVPPPLSKVPEHCPHCMKRFSGQSKPAPCVRCNQSKHTAKCGPCPSNPPASSSSGGSINSSRALRILSSTPTITSVPSLMATTGSLSITTRTVSLPETPF